MSMSRNSRNQSQRPAREPATRMGCLAIGGLMVLGAVAVSVLLVILISRQDVHLYPATRQALPPTYGSGIGADSLANIIVGGPRDTIVSYRFRATESAALDRIRVYLQDGEGYSAGSAGTLRIELQEDDESDLHHPSGKILAAIEAVSPEFGAGIAYSFPDSPELVAGRHYHVVFSNIDPAPRENFISINGLFRSDDSPTAQPGFPASEWTGLVRHGPGRWSSDRGAGNGSITPIMGLDYANGGQGGLGYMEVWVRDPRLISGPSKVREVFTVQGPSRTASKVSVRVKRLEGTGALGLRLEDDDGNLIQEGRIEASDVALGLRSEFGGSTWATLEFEEPAVMASGRGYRFVLAAPVGTTYSVFALREGSRFSYGSGTHFADGHAEYDEGSGWQGFHPGWSGPTVEGDLQFVFE